MSLISLSVRRPIFMIMVIMALVTFGIVGFINLPIDLMPDIEFPYVTVQTIYVGAGPEEIETSVMKPVEEQMTTVSGIKNITSYCMEGVGFMLLEFNLGVDPDLASIDVKDKIDAILFNLPSDLQKPVISKFDINAQPILNIALLGPQTPEALRHMADKLVKERLVRINGVASIAITGGREREIQVNLKREKLDGLGLSVLTVASILSAQTADIPGGHVSGDRKEYTVRVQGQFQSIDQIANVRIPIRGGTVLLSSIADIEDTYKEVRQAARYNKQNSVGLAIQKRPDANTVQVADAIFNALDAIQKELPSGCTIAIANDRSKFIKDSVGDMYRNVIIGIMLTSLMLLFFLGDWRVTLISTVTIPASIIVTFMAMRALGFTLNIITLMAIAIAVGTLVTNAIIVLENIVRLRDTGMGIMEASEKGASEVVVAVTASAMTNIAVFVPIATMEGMTGQFFKQLGLTITAATVGSLFLSFTLAPLMASRVLRTRTSRAVETKSLITRALDSLRVYYLAALSWGLAHRKKVVFGVIGLFFGTLIVIGSRLGSEFFPVTDQGLIDIELEMPSGTSITATDKALKTIEERAATVPEVLSVYASLGGTGSNTGVNYGSITIRLVDRKERSRTTRDVVGAMRPMLADIPDANIVLKEASAFGGGGNNADIQVEITGDDMGTILALTDSVTAKAHAISGLVDVKSSWKEAKPEIKFIPNRLKLDEYGISVAQLGLFLRYSLTGNDQTVYREENDEYKIRVQYTESDRSDIDAVENVTIPTPKGLVPIKVLCTVVHQGGAANINRKNRQRLVTVTANVAQGAVGTKAKELKQLTDKIPVASGYKIYYGGQQERTQESFGSLIQATLLAIILTYMVLAAILESLLLPIFIMLTIPLGLIGVILALFITGKSLSMISIMSMIMLIGVVVNNAILLIDYAMGRIKEGLSVRDAIYEACDVKFHAIIMMNLAIILSALPQTLQAASIQAPFAVTAIGGVAVSMLMTLFFIPVLYVAASKKG